MSALGSGNAARRRARSSRPSNNANILTNTSLDPNTLSLWGPSPAQVAAANRARERRRELARLQALVRQRIRRERAMRLARRRADGEADRISDQLLEHNRTRSTIEASFHSAERRFIQEDPTNANLFRRHCHCVHLLAGHPVLMWSMANWFKIVRHYLRDALHALSEYWRKECHLLWTLNLLQSGGAGGLNPVTRVAGAAVDADVRGFGLEVNPEDHVRSTGGFAQKRFDDDDQEARWLSAYTQTRVTRRMHKTSNQLFYPIKQPFHDSLAGSVLVWTDKVMRHYRTRLAGHMSVLLVDAFKIVVDLNQRLKAIQSLDHQWQAKKKAIAAVEEMIDNMILAEK